MQPNPYMILGIGEDSSPNEIRAAFHRAALHSHPDHGGSNEEMARVLHAYEVLRSRETSVKGPELHAESPPSPSPQRPQPPPTGTPTEKRREAAPPSEVRSARRFPGWVWVALGALVIDGAWARTPRWLWIGASGALTVLVAITTGKRTTPSTVRRLGFCLTIAAAVWLATGLDGLTVCGLLLASVLALVRLARRRSAFRTVGSTSTGPNCQP